MPKWGWAASPCTPLCKAVPGGNSRIKKGQLIIATHNPLMIASLHRNQVRILA